MTKPTLAACTFALLLISPFAALPAHSEGLETIINACEANHNCSHQQIVADQPMEFKVMQNGSGRRILCDQSGACTMLLPRGKKYAIPDMIALINNL